MKNNYKFFAVLAIATVFSCQKENIEPVEDRGVEQEEPTIAAVPEEILDKLDELAYNSNGVVPIDLPSPEGGTEEGYLIEGDMVMTRDQVMGGDIFADQGGIQSEQYRTKNLVRGMTFVKGGRKGGAYVNGRTLQVVGYTGKTFVTPYYGGHAALGPKLKQALRQAINEYNALGLNLKFKLSFSSNIKGADIIVGSYPTSILKDFFRMDESQRSQLLKMGQALHFNDIPSGGNPGKNIRFKGVWKLTPNGYKASMMHLLGHSLGMRHTDWFTGYSCGAGRKGITPPPVNDIKSPKIPGTPYMREPSTKAGGAVWIPGTPKTRFKSMDVRSIFNACYDGGYMRSGNKLPKEPSGKFTDYDKIALRHLYGR